MHQKTVNVEIQIGTWMAALGALVGKGLRLGSYIDIGSADGYLGLAFWRAGLFRDISIINIDANPLYEPSLRKIRDAIGGDYRICAVDERPGTIELHGSAHPYWASAVPRDDPYWTSVNGQIGQTTVVPCRTLDSIVEELDLKSPYAIKLDIQGLEARALRSGPRTLAGAAVVICESIIHNFRDIHAELDKAGFVLHDLTDLFRTPEHTLGQFYATYLHRDYASFRASRQWAAADNEAVIAQQHQRRKDLLEKIDALLFRIEGDRK